RLPGPAGQGQDRDGEGGRPGRGQGEDDAGGPGGPELQQLGVDEPGHDGSPFLPVSSRKTPPGLERSKRISWSTPPPAAAAWPTCSVVAPPTTSWPGPSMLTVAPLATSRSRRTSGWGVRTRTVRSAPAVSSAMATW